MPIVKNKIEKKWRYILKLRRSFLKWQSLKLQASYILDIASLRDPIKKIAALRILKRERCITPATGSGKSLSLCQCLP